MSKLRMISIIVMLPVIVLIDGCSDKTDLTITNWISGAPMPTARYGAAAGIIRDKLYVVGGFQFNFNTNTGNKTLNNLEIYSPSSDKWTAGKPMPTERSGAAAGVIDGKLYVVGGRRRVVSSFYLDAMEVYDPDINEWLKLTPMPTARAGAAAGVIDGKLYVAGGCNPALPDTFSTILEVYDPKTDTWESKSPMSTARWLIRAGVINDKLYVVGGLSGSIGDPRPNTQTYNVLEVYDPVSDSWEVKEPMLTKRYAPIVEVINDQLYVVGGMYEGPFLSYSQNLYNIVEVYDPQSDSWRTMTPMPTVRKLAASGVIGDRLYVVGGWNYEVGGSINTLEVYKP